MAPILLSDILSHGRSRSTTTFSFLLRRFKDLSNLIADPEIQLIILAPHNRDIDALPVRVWELNTERVQPAIQGDSEATSARAEINEESFVMRHLIKRAPGTAQGEPWPEKQKATTASGSEVWWEEGEDGKRVIQPENIEVAYMERPVVNGELWVINGVIGFAREEAT